MKFKTLLIDLDGTLIGAHTFWLHLFFTFHFVKALRGHQFSILKSLKTLHLMKLSMRLKSHQKNGVPNWTKAVNFFSQLSGKSLSESHSILSSTSLICFQQSRVTLFSKPEAIEFINWAKNHFELVLATNPLWPLKAVHFRLLVAEIPPDNFQFITHAENMSASKPHVEYYEELQSLRGLEPSSCLMIGNDERKDGPAREIGIEVFIIKKDSDFLKLKHLLQNSKETA